MAQTKQTVRFSLKANRLNGQNAAPWVAQTYAYKTIGQEELIAIMAGKNASVSRQEIIVVLDLMKAVIKDVLVAGDRVVTDLFNASVSICGGFSSADDDYAAGRNTVNVHLQPSAALKKEVAFEARPEKIRGRKPFPEVDSVFDYATRVTDSTVSPGHVAEIRGANLDCDEADETQGIFFVDAVANTKHRVPVIHAKTSSKIIFQVPALAPGTYGLVIRRAFGSETREGRLEGEVSVN